MSEQTCRAAPLPPARQYDLRVPSSAQLHPGMSALSVNPDWEGAPPQQSPYSKAPQDSPWSCGHCVLYSAWQQEMQLSPQGRKIWFTSGQEGKGSGKSQPLSWVAGPVCTTSLVLSCKTSLTFICQQWVDAHRHPGIWWTLKKCRA
jgi:hypothetical protein